MYFSALRPLFSKEQKNDIRNLYWEVFTRHHQSTATYPPPTTIPTLTHTSPLINNDIGSTLTRHTTPNTTDTIVSITNKTAREHTYCGSAQHPSPPTRLYQETSTKSQNQIIYQGKTPAQITHFLRKTSPTIMPLGMA